MAILDGVKNAATAQVAARANRSIRSGLTKVAGNLLGINTSFDGPQLGPAHPRAKRFTSGKYKTETFVYPLDVQEDPRHGHYIFFNINEQDKGQVARRSFASEMEYHENAISSEWNRHRKAVKKDSGTAEDFMQLAQGRSPKTKLRSREEIKRDYIKEHVIQDYDERLEIAQGYRDQSASAGRKDSSSLALQHPTTRRIVTAIALYMPPSVQVSYAASYNDSEIGVLAGMGANLIQAYKEGQDAKTTMMNALGDVEVGLKKAALGMIDAFAPGSKAMAQIISGRAITPKMELMFNGIGRREFSYEFTFIPKSRQEAEVIKKIVHQFKFHMLADYAELTGHKLMKLPSTFEIEYQYLGNRNDYLNRISTCALQSVDVTYGGDRFQAHADGVPQQTKLSLKFKELEIITRKLTDDGY